jgi:hypothetical protein
MITLGHRLARMNITKIKAEKQLAEVKAKMQTYEARFALHEEQFAVGFLPITSNTNLLSCEPYLLNLDFADDACN